MKSLITQAIQQRRLLRLTYNGRTRTVEPHILGVTTERKEAMLCWQVFPPLSQGDYWLLCELDSIFNLRALDTEIVGEPEGPPAPLDRFTATYMKLRG